MTNILTISSYNIWFDRTIYLERTKSLCEYINNINTDIVCLQEVRPEVYKLLITILKDFPYHYPKEINISYGCVTFSKYPILQCTDIKYPTSAMNRSLHILKINYPYNVKLINTTTNAKAEYLTLKNIEIIIGNSHFESLFDKISYNKEKLKQYEMARTTLDSFYQTHGNVILCSDTNIMDHEEKYFDAQFEQNSWSCCWKIKGTDNNKFTYDYENNIYVNKFRSRLDRILFKSNNCILTHFDIIPKPTINKYNEYENSDDIEPSDHFGIYATFAVNINKQN